MAAFFPILVLAPDDVADAVMTSGVIARLHAEVPNAAFTIVAGPKSAPLFRELPSLERQVLERRRGVWSSLNLWRRLRRRRWGLILDPTGGGMAGWLAAQRKAVAKPRDQAGLHKVERAARLLAIEDEPPPPCLFVSEHTRARSRELVGDDRPLLAVAPAADWVGAGWPVERMARAMVQLLSEDGPLSGGRLMVVGTPEDRPLAEELRRTISRARTVDLAGEADPLIVYAALSMARLYIGPAGGFTQMAAAAGAPTLGLYGPNDEAIEGPWGDKARTVRGPRGLKAIHAADPTLSQQVCHLLDLTVDQVVAAARDLLAETETETKTKTKTKPKPEPTHG
jgi:ADP-heptose:LPS heptosyltransferase